MGRFIDKKQPYQKHIYTIEEKETGVKRTTIGFDGMKRAKIVGTKMAGLLGEIYTFETSQTNIPFSFPCVQLQHINGQPREDFVPEIIVPNQKQTLKIAIDLLMNPSL